MSPVFVRFFRSNNPCPSCPSRKPGDRAPGKSLCGHHLAIARMAWRLWAAARRRLGRCIECAKRAQKGTGRCHTHREANAAKGRRYYVANKDRLTKYDDRRKEAWIAQGRCPGCPQHAALLPGRRRCDSCNAQAKAYESGNRIAVVDIHNERRAFRAQRTAAKAEEARQTLAAMGYSFTELPDGTPSLRRAPAAQ